MILIINVSKDRLHDLEFIKPITDLLKKSKVIHYKDLKQKDLDSAEKIIIAGTSLKDDEYLKDLEKFSWIKDYKKPILGICAGMQILALANGSRLKKAKEIGQTEIKILKENKLIKDITKVYSLHQFSVTLPGGFDLLAESSKSIQAIKINNHYGVLFHPEVFNKEVIENFAKHI
ncbi:gamma-glutamyl-gamma-aminobutyrate hydrolase family protein [Candidatus Woesearchaeota archaeon]|nr:gamma-glutamyl-gamma-aminobutyrate hydrolase family protein [Candidatus Woesearchaeota archaeon]